MSGHTYTHAYTQDNYSNPRCACAPRVNKEAMANARTRTMPVEGATAAFHSEIKLGPCTSVLRIVLHDIIINKVYIVSLYTIFRIAHQGIFILHVFIDVLLHAQHYQCKMCWNKALTFGVGSIKLCFHAIMFTQYMHAKMFSIQMLLNTFQLNCAEGLHFTAFSLKLLYTRYNLKTISI